MCRAPASGTEAPEPAVAGEVEHRRIAIADFDLKPDADGRDRP